MSVGLSVISQRTCVFIFIYRYPNSIGWTYFLFILLYISYPLTIHLLYICYFLAIHWISICYQLAIPWLSICYPYLPCQILIMNLGIKMWIKGWEFVHTFRCLISLLFSPLSVITQTFFNIIVLSILILSYVIHTYF